MSDPADRTVLHFTAGRITHTAGCFTCIVHSSSPSETKAASLTRDAAALFHPISLSSHDQQPHEVLSYSCAVTCTHGPSYFFQKNSSKMCFHKDLRISFHQSGNSLAASVCVTFSLPCFCAFIVVSVKMYVNAFLMKLFTCKQDTCDTCQCRSCHDSFILLLFLYNLFHVFHWFSLLLFFLFSCLQLCLDRNGFFLLWFINGNGIENRLCVRLIAIRGRKLCNLIAFSW